MAANVLEPAFVAGELSPSLYGRVDTARYHASAATMRNMFVSYRGGAYSRAGTAFVGYSRQIGRNFPPRLIPFQFNISQGLVLEFGHLYMRVIQNGAFVTETAYAISGIAVGNPAVINLPLHGFHVGDWINFAGGPAGFNNSIGVVSSVPNANHFTVSDVFGNALGVVSAFGGGATAARIYTLTTPYAEQDLPYLKFVQSADVMSFACVNPVSLSEYPPADLARISNSDWTYTPLTFAQTIMPPSTTSAAASTQSSSQSTTTGGSGGGTVSLPSTTNYQYVVTAISEADGSESTASEVAFVSNALDMSATAVSVTVSWSAVAGASSYNIYKASPGYAQNVPDGSPFGLTGSAFGTSFIDSNTEPDFTQVPPTHTNPFARASIMSVTMTAEGSGYNGSESFTINTSTGFNAVLQTIRDQNSGAIDAILVKDGGVSYAPTDTITIQPPAGGGGTQATATLNIGPQTGTYPSVVSYFQQRRVYGNTLNNPDTYYMSQPGTYLNFDSRDPTIDTDAITGDPWSLQVNGIQHMLPMPGGLVVLTGLAAWQLTGSGSYGSNAQPITPSSQQAQPQAYNGCSATVPPVKIDFDIVYVQAKGSTVRDISYDFFKNIYTGTDTTSNSSHLFIGHTMEQMCYTEEPYKIVWFVRDDGILLSLTYLKTEQVLGWARHDTLGRFKSACSVVEPPVDALYVATQRFINGMFPYMIERMDDRIWPAVEQTWCVDCGLSYVPSFPAAQLQASSPSGNGAISSVYNLVGGGGYSGATIASIVDDNGGGPGAGAAVALTIANGVITGAAVSAAGAGYVNPRLDIFDPTGAGQGASASLTLDNSATFTASAAVFGAGMVGWVIRLGGGIATIISVQSPEQVTANITTPIVDVRPNTTPPQVTLEPSGEWSLAAPIMTVTGLNHLVGATVTGLADGQVISPRVVSAAGTITLDAPASAVVVGLPFQAQFQSVFLDAGEPTVAGQRKKVAAATVRLEASRGVKTGANQPDGQALSPPRLAPTWQDLTATPDLIAAPFAGGAAPLWTGDVRVDLPGGWTKRGQIALQQDNPLPMQIIALVPEVLEGDTPSQQFPKRQGKGQ